MRVLDLCNTQFMSCPRPYNQLYSLLTFILKVSDFSEEELKRKREEAERKARRGEIDPMQEFTFTLISKVICNLPS